MAVVRTDCRHVRSSEDVVGVRQVVREWSIAAGLGLVDQTKIVTAASELARNLLDYGGGGTMTIEALNDGPRRGVRLTFEDQGPGIADVEQALRDGYTSGSGLGLGLGGARRLSNEFTIDSRPGEGTRITIAMAMTMIPPIAVRDPSQVGTVRRAATDLAADLAFDEHDTARVALVATELASNLAKHARDGEILLRVAARSPAASIELIALDHGPGIANLGRAMEDGASTAGSSGTGLGAIGRVSTGFDIYSTPAGTAVVAVLAATGAASPLGFEVGAVSVPYPGEQVCGDGFAVAQSDGRALVMVVDGLGHGPLAAAAAARARELFQAHPDLGPVDLMHRLHAGMRPTRGAALALAEIDARREAVRFCGVGNIAATILVAGRTRSMVSHHGTLGHDARRIAEFQYPWTPDALVVLNSDGLLSSWTLARYPGLGARAPSLIAAVLYRDCRRQRDDATVLVVRKST